MTNPGKGKSKIAKKWVNSTWHIDSYQTKAGQLCQEIWTKTYNFWFCYYLEQGVIVFDKRVLKSMCDVSETAKIYHMNGKWQPKQRLNISRYFEYQDWLLGIRLKLLARYATQNCWKSLEISHNTLEKHFGGLGSLKLL